MRPTPRRSSSRLNRRAALGGIGAATAAGLIQVNRATAQEATPDALAAHPLVGTWAVQTPGGVVPQIHSADGSVIAAFPPNYLDPGLGLTFQGTALGRWEPAGDRIGRFTALQALSDPDGAYRGAFLLAASVEVAEDGQTWTNTGPGRVVLRDAANTVVVDEELPADLIVTATRMGTSAESVIPPAGVPAATPEA